MESLDMAGHLIRRLHQQSTQVFVQKTQEAGYDLTPVQFAALTTVARQPDMDQRTLARTIGFDTSTIGGVLDTLFMGGDRTIRIVGEGDADNSQNLVEVLMPEQPLRLELLIYSRNTFVISLIVALMTALVLYLFVSRILIDPIRRLSENMLGYRKAPENATLIITATPRRRDEIGILEQELAAMETEIFTLLRQRRHLADLGLAVSKINHDLRNTLTSAQLLSDQVATLDDPKVQRLAPRLVHSIDRAVGFAQSVLDYGRQSSTPPKPVPIDVRTLVDEAAFEAGLLGHGTVKLRNEVADGVIVRADPDQLARVFVNLMKNAREALETQGETNAAPTITASAVAGEQTVVISIADNGPGLPPRARDNLFVAFEGSARAGGTGLGLAIAREIAEAHGGSLAFIDQPQGTRFDITLPTG